MKLRYTIQGLAELDAVLTAIEQESARGAGKVKLRIEAVTEVLLRHPRAGRLTRKPYLRRIPASPYPYLIFYQATDNEIIIHGVRHGARDPGTMPGQP